MSIGLVERAMVKRPKPSETIRVSAEMAEAVRLAAALNKISIMEYLDTAVLPIARRDYMNAAKKLSKPE